MLRFVGRLVAAATAGLLVAGTLAVGEARAEWPTGDLRVMVPYNPGGTTDNAARAIVPALEEILGVSITVENIGGAGGTIGMTRLAAAPADGSVFGITPNATLTIAPNMRPVSYDPLEDIQAVAKMNVAIGSLALRPNFPVDTMEEFVAYMNEHPGEVTFGSAGVGSTTHLYIELLKDMTGSQAIHVPFKGSNEAVNSLVGGHIDAAFDYSPLLAQGQAGAVKTMAVLKEERWGGLPDVPTLAEAGFADLQSIIWYGVVAPAGMSQEALDGMQAAVEEAVQRQDVLERFEKLGLVADYRDAETFGQELRDNHAFFAETLKRLNLAQQ